MSWNASVEPTDAGDFDAAVDSCVVQPPEDQLGDPGKAQLATARDCAKQLAETIVGDGGGAQLNAALFGHAYEKSGDAREETITVAVGQTKPAARRRRK